jgi:hypothetical protein
MKGTLDSFSFFMYLSNAPTFQAEVFAWDATNSRAMGSSLYESPVTPFPAPPSKPPSTV